MRVKLSSWFTFFVLGQVVLLSAQGHAGNAIRIAAQRMALLPVVVNSAEAIPAEKTAANELTAYLPADKYFKDHPEYYSLRDGKRVPSNGLDGNHACLTNPEVLRIVLEGVKEDIKKDPNGFCYTVAVNDGGCQTLCDCPNCRAVAEVRRRHRIRRNRSWLLHLRRRS